MKEHSVHIVLMQEIHIRENSQEVHLGYRFFFGGSGEPGNREYHGVGVVIPPFIYKYVHNMQPISSRLITLTLGTYIPCTLIGAYAPQSSGNKQEKLYLIATRIPPGQGHGFVASSLWG